MTNGTEDHTFNILRRTPIADMTFQYRLRFWEFYEFTEVHAAWLLENGWTEKDFLSAGKKYDADLRR